MKVNLADCCPCGREQSYAECCGRYIENDDVAPTAESLMRSRYTAYTQQNMDYLAKTMRGKAAERFDPERALGSAKKISWLGLLILKTEAGLEKDNRGKVEFIATYRAQDKNEQLHELSFFEKQDGRWYYVDGELKKNKVGRNDPCTCGSGKKYKRCCGA